MCGIQGTDEQLPRQPRNGGRSQGVQELGKSQMANEPNLSKNNPGTGVGSKELRACKGQKPSFLETGAGAKLLRNRGRSQVAQKQGPEPSCSGTFAGAKFLRNRRRSQVA